jgi:hypothetical protein
VPSQVARVTDLPAWLSVQQAADCLPWLSLTLSPLLSNQKLTSGFRDRYTLIA